MADDDVDTVQLTDLEVIQQFSLAVRGATASRADVIAALEADLAFLGAGRKAAPVEKAPAKAALTKAAPAKAAPAKKAAAKAPVKASRARRA